MKVLGTNIYLSSNFTKALSLLGYKKKNRNQFRILCKCKSMADANRKCAAVGLGDKVFVSGGCSETGNEIELNICAGTDIAINLGGIIGDDYVTIEQIHTVIGGNDL